MITMTPDEAHAAILAGTAPDGLTVEGSLDLYGNTSLTSLPPGLTVGESLDLHGCTGLTSLPPGLTVGRWLNMEGCIGLTGLPPGLTVGEWLDLNYCTRLTSLPPSLTIGGSLHLLRTQLTSLPPDLTVGRSLGLEGCTGLAHLCVGQDRRGYKFFRVQMADGLHVVAGCRNFLLEAAKHHWAENPECLALVQMIEQRFLVAA